MLSSSHFLIAVVIHEVDPAIYAATSSNAWMLKSPGTHNSSGTKRNFDCRLCSLLLAAPYYTPPARVPHHQKQQIFFKVFFFQKEGDSKKRNSKGRDHFPSKVELIMLLLRRRTSRYSTGIGVRPDSLTSTVLGAVLLVVEATRKSAQLKFNWVSCRE